MSVVLVEDWFCEAAPHKTSGGNTHETNHLRVLAWVSNMLLSINDHAHHMAVNFLYMYCIIIPLSSSLPHRIQWNPSIVDTLWGPSKVSCIERCPHFRGKLFLLRKHILGHSKVSLVQRCPYFRVSFKRGFTAYGMVW